MLRIIENFNKVFEKEPSVFEIWVDFEMTGVKTNDKGVNTV